MSKLTIAKKINVFTIALALIGIMGSAFSVIASVSGIRHAEALNDVYLSANLLVTKLKTNVLNIGADVDRYIATHQEEHITNIQDRIREPNVDKLGELLTKYNKELKNYQSSFSELDATAKDFMDNAVITVNAFKRIVEGGVVFKSTVDKINEATEKIYKRSVNLLDDYIRQGNRQIIGDYVKFVDRIASSKAYTLQMVMIAEEILAGVNTNPALFKSVYIPINDLKRSVNELQKLAKRPIKNMKVQPIQ